MYLVDCGDLNIFRQAWVRCARRGECDAWGSVQCCRLWGLWLDAGAPQPVRQWIRTEANRPAPAR